MRRIAFFTHPQMQEDPRTWGAIGEFAQTQILTAAILAVPAWGVALNVGGSLGGGVHFLRTGIGVALCWGLTWALPLAVATLIGDTRRGQWVSVVLNIAFATFLTALAGGLATPAGLLFAFVPMVVALMGTQLMTYSTLFLNAGALFFVAVNVALVPEKGAVMDLPMTVAILVAGHLGAWHLLRVRESLDLEIIEDLTRPAFIPPEAAQLIMPPRDHMDNAPLQDLVEPPLPQELHAMNGPHPAERVLDAVGDIVFCLTAHGKAEYVSCALERVLDIYEHDVTGKPIQALLHPEDWPIWEQTMTLLSKGREQVACELRMRNGHGQYVWMDLIARCAETDSEEPMVVVTAHDVDTHKATAIRMAEAHEKAETASQSKTRFLASVSHELRTPLNAIIGFSEVMRAEMFGPLGQRRYSEYADYIHESGQHLLDLINDILDMSKIEAGRYDLKLEGVCIARVIERCLKTIAHTAHRSGVKLSVDLPENVPQLHADARAMRQVLLNLLSNAVKFTPQGGEVTIRVRSKRDFLNLDITDTGVGIPADAMDRIGTPFEQAHDPIGFDGEAGSGVGNLTAGVPGTGLGLAIVKALVSMHNGSMTIESEEGKGTSIRISLPTRMGIGQTPTREQAAA